MLEGQHAASLCVSPTRPFMCSVTEVRSQRRDKHEGGEDFSGPRPAVKLPEHAVILPGWTEECACLFVLVSQSLWGLKSVWTHCGSTSRFGEKERICISAGASWDEDWV